MPTPSDNDKTSMVSCWLNAVREYYYLQRYDTTHAYLRAITHETHVPSLEASAPHASNVFQFTNDNLFKVSREQTQVLKLA